jgi:hypothetical protein
MRTPLIVETGKLVTYACLPASSGKQIIWLQGVPQKRLRLQDLSQLAEMAVNQRLSVLFDAYQVRFRPLTAIPDARLPGPDGGLGLGLDLGPRLSHHRKHFSPGPELLREIGNSPIRSWRHPLPGGPAPLSSP